MKLIKSTTYRSLKADSHNIIVLSAEYERLKKEFDIQVREKNKIRAELDILTTKAKH